MKKYILTKWTTRFGCKAESEPLASSDEAILRAKRFLAQDYPSRKQWISMDNNIQSSVGIYEEDGTTKVSYPQYVIT